MAAVKGLRISSSADVTISLVAEMRETTAVEYAVYRRTDKMNRNRKITLALRVRGSVSAPRTKKKIYIIDCKCLNGTILYRKVK